MLLLAPPVASNGVMVFASAGLSQNPWRLSMDGERFEPVPASAGNSSRGTRCQMDGRSWRRRCSPNRAMAVMEADARTGASRRVWRRGGGVSGDVAGRQEALCTG